MIRSSLVTGLLVMLALRSVVAAVPDFSGTWKVDAARGTSTGGGQGGGRGTGGGLGLGPSADELTIRQDAKTLTIEEWRGADATRLLYALDGQKSSNTIAAGKNAGAIAVSVSEWKADRLITTATAPAPPGSDVRMQYHETRYLDRDGSLVVETTVPGQTNARKVVYVKQRAPSTIRPPSPLSSTSHHD